MKLIALQPNSKKPLEGESWKKLMSADPAVWQRWLAEGLNIAMPTGSVNGGIMVVDWDSHDLAVKFFRENRKRIRAIVSTPRGGAHFYFRGNGPNAQGKPDIRGEGGYVGRPPSTIDDKPYRDVSGYEFRSVEELTEFQSCWYPTKEVHQTLSKEIKNARAYIGKIVAVSGQHGHNAAFRAACRLRDAGLTEVEALAALVEWNKTNALPPFDTKSLLHKVRDAYAKVKQ